MVTEMAPTYRANLTQPLIAQSKGKTDNGVQSVIDFMDEYDLTKDDMESILGKWYVFDLFLIVHYHLIFLKTRFDPIPIIVGSNETSRYQDKNCPDSYL